MTRPAARRILRLSQAIRVIRGAALENEFITIENKSLDLEVRSERIAGTRRAAAKVRPEGRRRKTHCCEFSSVKMRPRTMGNAKKVGYCKKFSVAT